MPDRIPMDRRVELVESWLDGWIATVLVPATVQMSIRRLVEFYKFTAHFAQDPAMPQDTRRSLARLIEAYDRMHDRQGRESRS